MPSSKFDSELTRGGAVLTGLFLGLACAAAFVLFRRSSHPEAPVRSELAGVYQVVGECTGCGCTPSESPPVPRWAVLHAYGERSVSVTSCSGPDACSQLAHRRAPGMVRMLALPPADLLGDGGVLSEAAIDWAQRELAAVIALDSQGSEGEDEDEDEEGGGGVKAFSGGHTRHRQQPSRCVAARREATLTAEGDDWRLADRYLLDETTEPCTLEWQPAQCAAERVLLIRRGP